jgi:hypothetical protein
MALKDILLRTQTHPVLATKGDILEMEELDDNIIEIYEAIRNRRTIETEADGGIMSLVGDADTFIITDTDGVDVETITIDADAYRSVLLINDTASDIKFVTTGNINTPFVIRAGGQMVATVGDDKMRTQTDSVGLWEAGTGAFAVQQVNNISANIASGDFSVAENLTTIASGFGSHSEGLTTEAIGSASHAQGINTKALLTASHAEGIRAVSYITAMHAHSSIEQSTASPFCQSGRLNLSAITYDDVAENMKLSEFTTFTGIHLREYTAINIEVQGIATKSDGTITTFKGDVAATYNGTDVVILDDTIAAVYDGITIGGVAAVGTVGGNKLHIQVTGVAATTIEWGVTLRWTERFYTTT